MSASALGTAMGHRHPFCSDKARTNMERDVEVAGHGSSSHCGNWTAVSANSRRKSRLESFRICTVADRRLHLQRIRGLVGHGLVSTHCHAWPQGREPGLVQDRNHPQARSLVAGSRAERRVGRNSIHANCGDDLVLTVIQFLFVLGLLTGRPLTSWAWFPVRGLVAHTQATAHREAHRRWKALDVMLERGLDELPRREAKRKRREISQWRERLEISEF